MKQRISDACDSIKALLIKKNESYGNSVFDPIRIFSKTDSLEQIKVRIDDKLSRFARGNNDFNENDIDDLIGYLFILKIEMETSKLDSFINSEQNKFSVGPKVVGIKTVKEVNIK